MAGTWSARSGSVPAATSAPSVVVALSAGSTLNGPYDFNFEFELPALEAVQIKAMYTAKVQIGRQTFLPPMLPCVTDFAEIPALTIPVSATPANLLAPLVDGLRQDPGMGCNTKVYNFTTVVTYPYNQYAPLMLR